MNMDKSLYRETSVTIVEEKHGGATIKHQLVSYISFQGENIVGYFNGNPKNFAPHFDFDIMYYKGKITKLEGNKIEFEIYFPEKNAFMDFKGQFHGDKLYVKYFTRENPSIEEESYEMEKVDLGIPE